MVRPAGRHPRRNLRCLPRDVDERDRHGGGDGRAFNAYFDVVTFAGMYWWAVLAATVSYVIGSIIRWRIRPKETMS